MFVVEAEIPPELDVDLDIASRGCGSVANFGVQLLVVGDVPGRESICTISKLGALGIADA